MSVLRNEMDALLMEIRPDPASGRYAAFWSSLGRYLVGDLAGIYITRVNDIKVSRGKKFIIVDGGMNHHLCRLRQLGSDHKRNLSRSDT